MTKNRITKKDRFNALLAIPAVAENADLVAFIEHELELLAKKNATPSGERKPTKTQILNEGIKDTIYASMEMGRAYLISEMMKEFSAISDYSSQKIVALVHSLVDEGKVEREVVKGKAYFSRV